MNPAYERYLKDDAYRAELLAAARHERAAAIHRLLIAPLKALLAGPRQRPSRMLRRRAAFG
jgi:hypothetical protein